MGGKSTTARGPAPAGAEAPGVLRFEIEDRVVGKKNNYEVHFDLRFWKAIAAIAAAFRAGARRAGRTARLWWIAPNAKVKAFEELVAWRAKAAGRGVLSGDLRMTLDVGGRIDRDNSLGALWDGIEKSGRIGNDAQFREVVLRSRTKPGCLVVIEEIGDDA